MHIVLKNIVVWGADRKGIDWYYKLIQCQEYEVVAFVDNNAALWKTCIIESVKCVSPQDLKSSIEFDYIIISCNVKKEIIEQIKNSLCISEDKVLDTTFKVLNCGEEFHLGNIKLNRELPIGFIDIEVLKPCIERSSLNELQSFYFFKQHRPIYKKLHYLEAYDKFFHCYRGKKVRVLEIGVWQGGSLQMWKDYFGEYAEIVGVDIDPKCKLLEEDRIEIAIGRQEDRNFLKYLHKKYGTFDVIIDDGGHHMEQQIIAFDEMFGALSDNGVYCCEDLCTSYWSEYEGGYKRESTFVEFSKGMIDEINAFQNRSGQPSISRYTTQVKSISYYNTIVFVEKQKPISKCITLLS